ncbi:MAG: exo-beta-N-acetylmuramidase NamZ family protein [Bacillota bacterium]|uniref:exo-beta-N-acetylmuramidase NamZ family protein n=1 Tax=Virgibacillus sp. AGTR TaxID=2812055 RepID=UPI001D04466B|nr:DUF1343 domain-containing protein [Virgibacillus sp. AGTR]MCC2249956.1 DUF1343 domain-containing protein [Virgibacillus sp. AGTR]
MKIKVLCLSTIALLAVIFQQQTVHADKEASRKEKRIVKPGIEVLLEEHLNWLAGKRVGLITNPTGVDRNLKSSIDLLYEHPDVNLTALFGPEHGIRGNREAGEYVESYVDEKTGLPVYSLYGPTWKPTEEMLEDIDVLLFDIQDIGSNVYTYIYTLGFAMEAAAEQGKAIIVLDRPNPIGGERVEGPLRSADTVSFMGRFLLPVRHGLTVGELATMWNHEYSLGVSLKVAKMKGWKRFMHFEDTQLPWIQPSPNIPAQETAYLYAGTELLDDTTLTTGLGTTKPFELVGAPWINGNQLAEEMNDRNIDGVRFRSAYFTPMFGKYEGERIGGVQVHIIDRQKIDLVNLGLQLLDAMRDQDPDQFMMTDKYANLIGDPEVPAMIRNNESIEKIIDSWQRKLMKWKLEVRNHYLLYGPYPKGAKPYKGKTVLGILPLDLSAAIGQSIPLSLQGFDKDGEKLEINSDDINWKVTDGLGYVEDSQFHALKDGVGKIIAIYQKQKAERSIDISAILVQNIRFGVHDSYTRVVFDLNKTVSNYAVEEEDHRLLFSIPYGEIAGELEKGGGSILIGNSPVIERIDYQIEGENFLAELHVKQTAVNVETPTYASRIVLDLQHDGEN